MGNILVRKEDVKTFIDSVEKNDIERTTRSLLSHPTFFNRALDKEGSTLIHVAVLKQDITLLDSLLSYSVNGQSETKGIHSSLNQAYLKSLNHRRQADGATPLMLAMGIGNETIVRKLLSARADLWLQDKKWGRTCLHYAAIKGHASVIGLVIENSHDHPRDYHSHMLECDSDHRPLVDLPTAAGMTPLMFACWFNQAEAARQLLKYGAGFKRRTWLTESRMCPLIMRGCPNGSSALHVAALAKSKLAARAILLEYAAVTSVDSVEAAASRRYHANEGRLVDPRLLLDSSGYTAFSVAGEARNFEMLWLLNPLTSMTAILRGMDPTANEPLDVPTLVYIASKVAQLVLLQQIQTLVATRMGKQQQKVLEDQQNQGDGGCVSFGTEFGGTLCDQGEGRIRGREADSSSPSHGHSPLNARKDSSLHSRSIINLTSSSKAAWGSFSSPSTAEWLQTIHVIEPGSGEHEQLSSPFSLVQKINDLSPLAIRLNVSTAVSTSSDVELSKQQAELMEGLSPQQGQSSRVNKAAFPARQHKTKMPLRGIRTLGDLDRQMQALSSRSSLGEDNQLPSYSPSYRGVGPSAGVSEDPNPSFRGFGFPSTGRGVRGPLPQRALILSQQLVAALSQQDERLHRMAERYLPKAGEKQTFPWLTTSEACEATDATGQQYDVEHPDLGSSANFHLNSKSCSDRTNQALTIPKNSSPALGASPYEPGISGGDFNSLPPAPFHHSDSHSAVYVNGTLAACRFHRLVHGVDNYQGGNDLTQIDVATTAAPSTISLLADPSLITTPNLSSAGVNAGGAPGTSCSSNSILHNRAMPGSNTPLGPSPSAILEEITSSCSTSPFPSNVPNSTYRLVVTGMMQVPTTPISEISQDLTGRSSTRASQRKTALGEMNTSPQHVNSSSLARLVTSASHQTIPMTVSEQSLSDALLPERLGMMLHPHPEQSGWNDDEAPSAEVHSSHAQHDAPSDGSSLKRQPPAGASSNSTAPLNNWLSEAAVHLAASVVDNISSLGDSDDYDDCGICFVDGPMIMIKPCNHQICADCATELVKIHSCQPVPCPSIVNGFDSHRKRHAYRAVQRL